MKLKVKSDSKENMLTYSKYGIHDRGTAKALRPMRKAGKKLAKAARVLKSVTKSEIAKKMK
jgi:hypothetical protein